MKHTLTLLFAACLMALSAGAELVLVENGAARMPIVLFESAPPYTRRAADDLAQYIEKASGARPEVIQGAPDPLPESAIWVGVQPAVRRLFPDIDFDFRNPEEVLIAANERHLVIAGRDVWDPDRLTLEGSAFIFGVGTIDGFQSEYGTANAVYTFLHDKLGVRWLWPGEVGEDVPTRRTIALAPFEVRYHPRIRQRHSLFFYLALYRHAGRFGHPASNWARFNRVQLDSLYVPVQGHGFADWFSRFHEAHPEYFALQPDGTRSGFPAARYAKICDSSPAVWDQWVADVEKGLERYPTRTAFSAAANDSWRSGHCICENCRAWDHPDGEPVTFTWQGLSQMYVALSDRQVTFANRLAERLAERFPDRDLKAVILAYGLSRPPPVEAVAGDGVIVGMVHSFLQRDSAEHRDWYKAWAKAVKNHIWRPNIGAVRMKEGGPVDLGAAMDTFRLVSESGAIGISIDTVMMYWATQGPLYYLMAQLAWDPSQDGHALMADYYRRGFGPASGEIAAYWQLLEETRRQIDGGGAAWGEAFVPGVFERAGGLLDEAEAKVAGEREVYGRRIAFFRAGLDFLRLTTENLAILSRLDLDDPDDEEALARAKANWAEIDRISREFPFALNSGHVQGNPGAGRLRGICPHRD